MLVHETLVRVQLTSKFAIGSRFLQYIIIEKLHYKNLRMT